MERAEKIKEIMAIVTGLRTENTGLGRLMALLKDVFRNEDTVQSPSCGLSREKAEEIFKQHSEPFSNNDYYFTSSSLEKAISEICALSTDKPVLSEWISVEERLPENDNDVLACTDICDALILTFEQGKWYGDLRGDEKVTHWMPLPEKPTE